MKLNVENDDGQISPTGIWPIEYNKYHVTSNILKQFILHILPNNVPVYDFGCGSGSYIKHLLSYGYSCIGYEGTYQKNELPIKQQDITIELPSPKTRGSVLCLEVMEHIPSKFEKITLDNIIKHCDNHLIISWGIVGQPGIGHVNCRSAWYVIRALSRYGFKLQKKETRTIRDQINRSNKQLWFTKSLYIFKRC